MVAIVETVVIQTQRYVRIYLVTKFLLRKLLHGWGREGEGRGNGEVGEVGSVRRVGEEWARRGRGKMCKDK
ncbi:MAG: hypothetical protein II951_03080 [Bacteroidales bacterium]|nr:hypothetical protein [Bacteroidales bacterium]